LTSVSLSEAQARLAALLQAVARGEEVVITEDGVPVARLVPVVTTRERPAFGSARAAMERAGLTDQDVTQALAPMGKEDLAALGFAMAANRRTA
jgi:prevent-host-death family protein